MHTFMDGRGGEVTMTTRPAVDVFSEWADAGRDEGMERGHSKSVDAMLEWLIKDADTPFSAVDIGCGNGWVVRRLAQHPMCKRAVGVDGAPSMIAKAYAIDPTGEYVEAMLPQWSPDERVDRVHTMECLYYLKDPLAFLKDIGQHWMNPNGRLVIGVDHYAENTSSLDWPSSLNVHMTTLTVKQWKDGLKQAGFIDIEHEHLGAKEGWAGTLMLTARRPA